MKRYLLHIAYLGTPFRGLQRQVTAKNGRLNDPSTVQGQIEMALKILRPVNEPCTVTSSRTDSGVHAIHSTMHVDLEGPDGRYYQPEWITKNLNKHFDKLSIPIRILKTQNVPAEFNCRYKAVTRSYLYRLGVINIDKKPTTLWNHIPLTELNRCTFIGAQNFDIEIAKEAANYFVGLHDFRTFMHKAPEKPNKVTRRTIYKLEIDEIESSIIKYQPWCTKAEHAEYHFYNFFIQGNGFLYKQVRRTVASLISVAKGIVTPRDIKFMLEIPSHRSWDSRIRTVPAHGLYLSEVTYSQQDQDTFVDVIEEE